MPSSCVVGGGPLAEDVEQHAGERARMLGPQPLDKVPLWMAACDVLVLPSHSEGTPNVALEALASGRRIVATAVGGTPDLITSAVLGALVPPKDIDALADALVMALQDAVRSGRGRAARCARRLGGERRGAARGVAARYFTYLTVAHATVET